MDKGIYCLVFRNPSCTVTIGALGEIALRKGWHIYVGSALGSGGLARLERHIALSRNKDKQPKWHVDWLSVNPSFCLRFTIHALTEERLECRLARTLGGVSILGFGSSDCDCASHLFYRRGNPLKEVHMAFRSLGLDVCTKTLMNPKDSKD
jgi:Uri superfamily endonuclease